MCYSKFRQLARVVAANGGRWNFLVTYLSPDTVKTFVTHVAIVCIAIGMLTRVV